MGKDPSSISIMIVGVIFALGFVQLLADTDKVHGKHKFCAEEGEICACKGYVRMGLPGSGWSRWEISNGTIDCSTRVFGGSFDQHQRKRCVCREGKPRYRHHLARLFNDRLEHLLPHTKSITAEQVARVEDDILQFHVPKLTVVELIADYIPIRWKSKSYPGGSQAIDRCPNCVLRRQAEILKSRLNVDVTDAEIRTRAVDVRLHVGCPTNQQKSSTHVSVCGCGESQDGTGAHYYRERQRLCDVNAGFHPSQDPMATTYAARELAVPAWNLSTVTDLVRRLQTMPDLERAGLRSGVPFIHSNCGGVSGRGSLFRNMVQQNLFKVDRFGQCMHNADLRAFEPQRKRDWFWHDSEGNRDATKTNVISHYKFAEALENTKSRDYFTEKRYQAFFANTLPILFRNDNSEDFTPDPSSAIFVEDLAAGNSAATARALAVLLQRLEANTTAYLQYFEWKRRGPRRNFVKHLFRSANYLLCRVCEHVSSHHRRPH